MARQSFKNRLSTLLPFSIILLIVALFLWLMAWDIKNTKGKMERIAIEGYDPISFFHSNTPVYGDSSISWEWNQQIWHFSSHSNRFAFMENPGKYAPQYGGNCAFTTSLGKAQRGLVKFWQIEEGKLYFNANPVSHWLWKKIPNRIAKADLEWQKLNAKKQAQLKSKTRP